MRKYSLLISLAALILIIVCSFVSCYNGDPSEGDQGLVDTNLTTDEKIKDEKYFSNLCLNEVVSSIMSGNTYD